MVNMRDCDYVREMLESFKECAKHADILSIETMGGKEVFDHAVIRNDIAGMLFGIGILGAADMEWMWPQIVQIAKDAGCIAGSTCRSD